MPARAVPLYTFPESFTTYRYVPRLFRCFIYILCLSPTYPQAPRFSSFYYLFLPIYLLFFSRLGMPNVRKRVNCEEIRVNCEEIRALSTGPICEVD